MVHNNDHRIMEYHENNPQTKTKGRRFFAGGLGLRIPRFNSRASIPVEEALTLPR